MSLLPQYHHIALAAGGAHYPTVMGDLGNRFAQCLLQEILVMCQENPQLPASEVAEAIKQRYELK